MSEPGGWRLVPINPTSAMTAAAELAAPPTLPRMHAAIVYDAMLGAAPSPPEPPAPAGVDAATVERCAQIAEAYPTEPPFGDIYTADNLIRHGQDGAAKDIAKFIRALLPEKGG